MQKYKRRKGSKRWTSVPVIKTMGTMLASLRNKWIIKIAHVFHAKSSTIKREIYLQRAKVEREISHKYHKFTYPPYSIDMHTLVWLYASILSGSISWLYNTCIASMPILVIGTPISSIIYTFSYKMHNCWRSLSTKYNHQINREKDPNTTNTQT